jgi:hypothetical protein
MSLRWIPAEPMRGAHRESDSRPLPRLAILAAAEFLLFLFLFEPFLKEFRLRSDYSVLEVFAFIFSAVTALCFFRRWGWDWMRWMRPTLACCALLNWAAAVYSSGNWPIEKKAAGYLAVWLLYFFHMLSLYTATWLPCMRFQGNRGLWIHWTLIASVGTFLVVDFEYFRLSGNHVGIGYILLFFEPDTIAHMGVQAGFWIVPALKIGLIATAAAFLPLIEISRRRAP